MESNNNTTRNSNEPIGSAQPVYVALPPPSEPGMNLVDIWIMLWKGKWLIVGVTSLFAIAGVIYSLSATPIYHAEVILAPVTRNQPGALAELGGLASLAGINLNTNGDDGQALAILRSRNFIAEFIRDNSLLPVLFPDEWDAENQRWMTSDPEMQRDIRDGVKLFIDDVRSISEDSQTGLITLAIEWTDPEIAASWATDLVERVNEKLRQEDIEESQRKLDFLHEQLSQASLVELRQAISRVIEEQVSAMMLAQSQIEYAFTVIDPAVVPKQRSRPKRTIMVIVAALLGGFIGTFILIIQFAFTRQSSVRHE